MKNKKLILVIGRNIIIEKSLRKNITIYSYKNIYFKNKFIWKFYCDTNINTLDYEGIYSILDENNCKNILIINIDKVDDNIDTDLNDLKLFELNNKFNLNLMMACTELKITNFINIVPLQLMNTTDVIKYSEHINNIGFINSKLITCLYSKILSSISPKFKYTNIFTDEIISEYSFLSNDQGIVYELIYLIKKCEDDKILIPYHSDKILHIVHVDYVIDVLLNLINSDNLLHNYRVSTESNNLLTIQILSEFVNQYFNERFSTNKILVYENNQSIDISATIDNKDIINLSENHENDILLKINDILHFYNTNSDSM